MARQKQLLMGNEGDDLWFLTDYPHGWAKTRPPMPNEITADKLARMLDRDCENANEHSLVGANTKLVWLMREAGVEQTKIDSVIYKLWEHGGLTGNL